MEISGVTARIHWKSLIVRECCHRRSSMTQNPSDGTNEILTAPEVAKLLKVSTRSILRWKAKGEIPYLKVGDLLRFRRCDIDVWLSQNSVGSSK